MCRYSSLPFFYRARSLLKACEPAPVRQLSIKAFLRALKIISLKMV